MRVKPFLVTIVASILVISVGGLAIASKLNDGSPVVSVGSDETDSTSASIYAPTKPSVAATTDIGATDIDDEKTTAPDETDNGDEESGSTASSSGSGQAIGNDYKYAYAGFTPALADTSAEWNLLLVNREFILPEGFEPKLDNCIEGDENSLLLDYRVAPHYSDMYKAAKADGVTLTPISGYRSVTRQTNNFENKISYYENQGFSRTEATKKAARTILPPGTSEHNAGLAMDIISLETSFEDTKAFAWLEENAADYGFILRYPADKTDITHISYEPWHWRYVGVEAAQAMKKSGQCFEEYLGVA